MATVIAPLAYLRKKKKVTARQLSELAGQSIRTAQRHTSSPRVEYLADCANRKETAQNMRNEGKSIKEIMSELGVSRMSVHRYIKGR